MGSHEGCDLEAVKGSTPNNSLLRAITEEQLTAFITHAKGDFKLQEKLKDAADVDAIAAITRESGFSISADDLKNVQSEISDEELENVAGGC